MKKLLLFAILIFFATNSQAQKASLEVGSILTIEKPTTSEFNHIHFPKKNFIIKNGGLVNYQREFGQKVEVIALETKSDGTRQARIKRIDGRKFFQSQASVLVDLDKAIEAGEIRV